MVAKKFLDRSELYNYILRKLGGGIWDVELTDDQIEDNVDDAIKKFQRNHWDACGTVIISFAKDNTTTTYTLDDRVLSVNNIMYGRYSYISAGNSGTVSDTYLLYGRNPFVLKSGGYDGQVITPYYINEQWFMTMRNLLVPEPSYDFSPVTHELNFHSLVDRRAIMDYTYSYFIECTMYYSEDQYPDLYDHDWFKEYAIALCGEQWGKNLMKFRGIKEPGGGELNGEAIYREYKEMKLKLEELLQSSGPPPQIYTF